MPTCNIFTSLSKDKIPDDFLLDTSKLIAQLLGKPESYVTVRVVPDQMMCHGGSTEPCASIQLYSIGCLGDKNNDHTKKFGEFIECKLGLAQNRFYITFIDLDRNDCGYGGKTFAN